MNEPVLARLNNLMALREEVEQLGTAFPWEPAADWHDLGTHLLLVMDVPGLDAEHLELLEEGDDLTIAGERGEVLDGELLSRERPGGRFVRTLNFPVAVRAGSAEASLSGGVLKVRFEKQRKTWLQLGTGEE
ncbi:Hsp20/alpha crystallin family protein [Deinococcus altitudinis]|uniref:Hsp20/alpha crystallin family protein n=1 Tax=Deinococcus altitudinis TaxID=468914 RepID=UPI0038916CE0